MSCFSLEAIKDLLIWTVVVIAIIAIVRLIFPAILGAVGVAIPDWLSQALKIVITAAVCILLIIVVFWLISCLTGGFRGFRGELPAPAYTVAVYHRA